MSAVFEVADIFVKYTCGAYVTNTVRGKRCSSTSAAQDAARGLAVKLFGDRLVEVELMGHGDATQVSRFQARARPQ